MQTGPVCGWSPCNVARAAAGESGGYFAWWRGRSRQGAGIIDAATRGGLASLGQGVPVMMRS